MNKQRIVEAAEHLESDIIDIRHHLHAHPELSFQEHKTAQFIAEKLKEWGIPSNPVAGTGVTGVIKGEKPGKNIVLRADIDALPITEGNDVSYKSVNPGVMHACGHDLHTASLLGAVRIIHNLSSELAGTVRFLFQPGEESLPGGAKEVIESGLLSDPVPDLIIAQHVFPDLPYGQVGIRAGSYMASSDEIYLNILGKGGHAALPNQLVDPVLIASHLLVSLQQIVSRKSPPDLPTVLSFGKFIAEGATNVIPSEVSIEGTFRTMDESWRQQALDLINSSATGLVESMGAKLNCRIVPGYPTLVNHPEYTNEVKMLLTRYLGDEQVIDLPIRMGAEDFARYGQIIPAVYYRLGTGIEGRSISIHHPEFDVDERAIKTGAEIMAFLAMQMT